MPSPWMTRVEAADYLRLSVDTVDRRLVPMKDSAPGSGLMRYQLMPVPKSTRRQVRILAEDVYAACPVPEPADLVE